MPGLCVRPCERRCLQLGSICSAKRQQRENEDVISGWEADEAKGPPLPALGATGGSKDASRR